MIMAGSKVSAGGDPSLRLLRMTQKQQAEVYRENRPRGGAQVHRENRPRGGTRGENDVANEKYNMYRQHLSHIGDGRFLAEWRNMY